MGLLWVSTYFLTISAIANTSCSLNVWMCTNILHCHECQATCITNNNLKIWGQFWNQTPQRNMEYNKGTRKLETTYVSWVVWPPMFVQYITSQYFVRLSRIPLYFNRNMINYCMNCNADSPWKRTSNFTPVENYYWWYIYPTHFTWK